MTPKIYFFTSPEPDNYQDDIIPLAEGLRELGIEFYSLNDYWLQGTEPNSFLFQKAEGVHFSDCDIVVVPYTWPYWRPDSGVVTRRPLPANLFEPGRKYRTVFFDFHDGHNTISWQNEFREFDVIFRCKYNEHMLNPSNWMPWAYGYSNRVLKEIGDTYIEKRHVVSSNFGASHPWEHPIRKEMRLKFLPLLKKSFEINEEVDDLNIPPKDSYQHLMWMQANRRHCSTYYRRLNTCLFSLAFCGDLIPSGPFDARKIVVGGRKAKIRRDFHGLLDKLSISKSRRIVQWDSWRFWESMVAGSIPIHIDLERAGVKLPVMPQPWKHYIPVNTANLNDTIERMLNVTEVEALSKRVHEWVRDNYSPRACAKRFLKSLDY